MSLSNSSPESGVFVSPPRSTLSSPSCLSFSSSSLVSTLGESLPSATNPTIPKTFIPARCHCGLNSFVAVFAKPQTQSSSDIADTHSSSYPSSSASISSKLCIKPSNANPSVSSSSEGNTTASDQSQPILNDLCHCSTCRHTSGQLATYHVAMLGPPLASPSPHTPYSQNSSRPLSPDDTKPRIAPPSSRARVKSHFPYLGLGAGMGQIMHGLCGEGSDASGLISVLNAVTEDDGLDRAISDEGSNEESDWEAESEWERPFDLSGLTEYRTSPNAIRLFCKSCSAHLFFVYTSNPNETLKDSTVQSRRGWKWCVAGGVLERTAGIVKLGHHIWVGDTFDGGIADHLQIVDGMKVPRYREGQGSDQVSLGWRKALLQQTQSLPLPQRRLRPHHTGASERLPLYCHCGSIRLLVTRPTYQSTMISGPFPDIICPSYARLSKRRNPRDLKWWLRPPLGHPVPSNDDPEKNATHATRYLAGHCMCNACRLTSGMEVQSWLWIPNCNVLDARTGEPVVLDYAAEPSSVSNGTPGVVYAQSSPEFRRPRAGCVSPSKSILSDGSDSPTFTASPASSGRSSPAIQQETKSLNFSLGMNAKEDVEELYLPSGRLKALKQYTPSPGRYRESCSKCGASILLWSTQVPDIICVAAGLIDENYGHGGARAEAWFDWYTERVAFVEEALDGVQSKVGGSSLGASGRDSKGLDGIGSVRSSVKATAESLVAGLAQLKKESEDELK